MNKHSFMNAVQAFRDPNFKRNAFERKCFEHIANHLTYLVTDFELKEEHHTEGQSVILPLERLKVDKDLELVLLTEVDFCGRLLTYAAFHTYSPKPTDKDNEKEKREPKSEELPPHRQGFYTGGISNRDSDQKTPWPNEINPQDTETHFVRMRALQDILPTLGSGRAPSHHSFETSNGYSLRDYLENDNKLRTALRNSGFRMFYSQLDGTFTIAFI